MIETRTVFVPGIALNYDGNMLESVGIGGEMFRRETPLSAENTRLRAENAKLRELLLEAYEAATKTDCGGCYHVETCNEMPYCIKWAELEHRMRDELGIEVSE